MLYWLVIVSQVHHFNSNLQRQFKESFPQDFLQWGIFMTLAFSFQK